MILVPKAKPVRIRIKSGGEEHFSLDSLKRNFSVLDLWEAMKEKRLSLWLRQQREDELAAGIEGFCEIKELSVDDYVQFSNLFFTNETFKDVESLLKFYKNAGLVDDFNNAISELFGMMSFAEVKKSFELFRDKKGNDNEEWIDLFFHKINELEITEEIECHEILSTLYNQQGEFKKMKYHQEKAKKLKTI